MMKLIQALCAFFILLVSCNTPGTSKEEPGTGKDSSAKNTAIAQTDTINNLGYFKLEGDSLLIPSFEIEVSLSPKAKDKILKNKETIIVAVYLDGIPKDTSQANLAEDGTFYVGNAQKEISYGQVAKFDDIKISKKIYDQLADKDPNLLVNVYTGRKSSENNLIFGDLLSEKLSKVINRRFILNQKLITGDD